MLWKNEEQYSDYTAGVAMFRALSRCPDDPGPMDDEGFRLLAAAVVRRAADDYAWALRALPALRAVRVLEETKAFFRSDYFRRLTGLSGEAVLRMIRKEMENG